MVTFLLRRPEESVSISEKQTERQVTAMSNMSVGANKYPHVFAPIEIRGHVYRNRLCAAPTMFAHSIFTIPPMAENVYRMVENRAKGGFGEVATGELCINFEEGIAAFVVEPIDFTKYEGKHFEMIKEYADRIKKHGAIALLEFSHEGSDAMCSPHTPYGPEERDRPDGVHVEAMDERIMQKICDDLERVARFTTACGFDGMLFHGGHGFIFQQFVSPLTNHRTDEYGGSMENRARFPKRMLEACRRGLGEDKIIQVRMSAEDGLPGGMTIDHCVEFCKEIDGMADIIQISNGIKALGNGTNTFSDFFDKHGVNVEFAAKVKAAVTKSLVSVIGGINSPEMCEEIIASGKADFVAMGRQCFADPNFPTKMALGREDHIRRCVRCMHCYPGVSEHPTDVPIFEVLKTEWGQKIYSPMAMGDCAINPNSGFGNYPERLPAPTCAKRVLIVGGGVAGLQAAITAKERGHWVTLVEKTGVLGGTINFTEKDADKTDLCVFKDLLIREANECGAKILLNTECTPELIDREKPDYIIVAVGGYASVPPIEGIEKAIKAADVYDCMDQIGQRVVFLGGGLIGCEVAIHLAKHGHRITIVEKQGRMAPEVLGYYRNALLTEMDRLGIVQMLETSCEKLESGAAVVSCEGATKRLEADTLIVALGMKPDTATVDAVRAMAGEIPVLTAGDCATVGKLADAVRGGYNAAMAVL